MRGRGDQGRRPGRSRARGRRRRDARQHDVVAVGRAPGAGHRRVRALRRPARLQPGAQDEARRARLPRRGHRRDAPSARARCARRWARRPSRSPTCRASWSTGCSSPTSSARSSFMEETGMAPEDVDLCMTLGAGHPMGPLALLDYVGLDVSVAIGDAIGADGARAPAHAGRRGRPRAQERPRPVQPLRCASTGSRTPPTWSGWRWPSPTSRSRSTGSTSTPTTARPSSRSRGQDLVPVLEADHGEVVADSMRDRELAGEAPARSAAVAGQPRAPRRGRRLRRVVQPRLEGPAQRDGGRARRPPSPTSSACTTSATSCAAGCTCSRSCSTAATGSWARPSAPPTSAPSRS